MDTSTYGRALSWPERYQVLSKEVLTQTFNLAFHRLNRDRAHVVREYGDGKWKKALENKDWLRAGSLEEYLTTQDVRDRVAKIEGRLVRIRTCDYYQFRTRMIQETIARFAGDATEIVEVGCGAGQNLLTLAQSGTWKRLVGLELSENGAAAGRAAAAHFGLGGVMEFGTLDLTRSDDPGFARVKGRTAFSYYCLEQLKYHTPVVIENLLRAGVRRVIHIEPTTELLSPWSVMDWINGAYVTRNDYQNNLIRTVRRFEKQGRLRILRTERLGYAPTPRNDPVLVCWEPAGETGPT
jgi:SAM-dependent methyltransferase